MIMCVYDVAGAEKKPRRSPSLIVHVLFGARTYGHVYLVYRHVTLAFLRFSWGA